VWCFSLIQVLGNPSESLSISLSLEYGAHEQLQGASVQLSPADLALARGLSVQAEQLPQLLLARCTWPINLVAEDQDRAISQLLVSQQGLQLYFALVEPGSVTAVNQEHDGVHSWEVIFPDTPCLVMATKIKGCKPYSIYGQFFRCWVQCGHMLGHSVIFQHV